MKYPYIVNKNGVYYPAGAEVPEDNPKAKTKTDINRLKLDDLKALALGNGIEGANDMTGEDLKKALIEKLGL